ncbi:hypothetical protein CL614_10405 [archaeon]|nr:hypothetical protein [archaeon]
MKNILMYTIGLLFLVGVGASFQSALADTTINPHATVHVDYGTTLENTRQSDGDFRRLRVGVDGTMTDLIDYNLEVDASGGDLNLDNAWIKINLPVHLTMGKFKQPLGFARSISADNLAFIERPMVSDLLVDQLSGGKRLGIGANYMWSGFWVGTSLASNENNFDENLISWNNRVAWSHTLAGMTFHVGGNYSTLLDTTTRTVNYVTEPELRLGGVNIIDVDSTGVNDYSVYGLEGAFAYGPMWMSGEYYYATDSNDNYNGHYIETGLFLTGETKEYSVSDAVWGHVTPNNSLNDGGFGAIEIVGRYSYADVNRDEETIYTVGVNWYLTNNVKAQLNYAHSDIPSVGVRLAVNF